MERLDNWTPIIVAIVSGLLGQPIIQLIFSLQKRRLKNLLNAIDTKGFIFQCNEDFKSKFVIPDFQENYFFIQTGIKTNHKSISLFIQLKDKLGDNFTWNTIREAKPHLRFSEGKLVVAVNKWERLYKNISLIIGFGLFILGISIVFYFNQYPNKTLNETLMILFMTVVPIVFGFLLMKSVQSIISATVIEKRLRQLE